jgi:hypothetical protein
VKATLLLLLLLLLLAADITPGPDGQFYRLCAKVGLAE